MKREQLSEEGRYVRIHVMNFFYARRNAKLTAPIEEVMVTMTRALYYSFAYRLEKGFDIVEKTGYVDDGDAMKFWNQDHEQGWEPRL